MKQRKTTLFIAALTALVLLGGIAFSVVKAQNSNPEAPLPEPEVSRNAQSPTDFETRMEQRNQMRAERQAQRQARLETCDCTDLSEEECQAKRLEHRLNRLEERFEQGLITQEQYDAIRAKMEAGELPPYGPQDGTGFGFGNQGQGIRQGHGMRQGQGMGQGQGMRQGQGGNKGPRGNGNPGECPLQP